MDIIRVKDYLDMSRTAAHCIYDNVQNKKVKVLGLATGGTPLGVYKELIESVRFRGLSFEHIHTVNLDEYIGLSSSNRNSYHYYMYINFFQQIGIPLEQTHLPSGDVADLQEECNRYEALIEELNGVDLQILGIGENGHIGFNEPGTSFDSKTHIVDLTPSTRDANARYFNEGEVVPTQAITMGIQTIMKSKHIILLASGKSKAKAINQLIHGQVAEACPATILQQHPNLTLIADEEALSYEK